MLLPPRTHVMPHRFLVLLMACVLLAFAMPYLHLPGPALSLAFVPNHGQQPDIVHFEVDTLAGRLFFTSQYAALHLPGGQIRLRFSGADPSPAITAANRLPGIVNHYIGSDPSLWRLNIPTYAALEYHNLYPGITLRYDGVEGTLKGTYTVAAGADPSRIAWTYEGAQAVELLPNGDLSLTLPDGSVLAERAPLAWQDIHGERVPVAARFLLDGTHVRFALGSYDSSAPLVIDPTLEYSTYLGGNDDDLIPPGGMRLTSGGSIILAGGTESTDFTTTVGAQQTVRGGGAYDAFVVMLDSTGTTRQFATYLGGTGNEQITGLAIDSANNIYIVGQKDFGTFPTTVGAFDTTITNGDGWAAKLNPNGQLQYATFIGGSGYDQALDVAVDSSGSAYISGVTISPDFPVVSALQSSYHISSPLGDPDGFVLKLNPTGTAAVYSTYLGGAKSDRAFSIDVDSAGVVTVAGDTASSDFPMLNALQTLNAGSPDPLVTNPTDFFITRLNAAGNALIYSTYLGGSSTDVAYALDVDSTGAAVLAGYSLSANFPLLNAFDTRFQGQAEGILARLSPNGALTYASYFGGSTATVAGGTLLADVTVGTDGRIYAVGATGDLDLPTRDSLHTLRNTQDAVVIVVAPDGTYPAFASYVGGTGVDIPSGTFDSAQAVVPLPNNSLWLAGFTPSADFPAAGTPLQGTKAAFRDVFLARLSYTVPATPATAPPLVAVSPNSITADTTPAFKWGIISPTVSYQLQIARDMAFTSGVQTIAQLANSFVPDQPLSEGVHYWRVRAVGAAPGPWSAIGMFTVDTTPPPFVTVSNAPVGTVTTVQPLFSWSSAGAVRYELQLDTVNPPLTTVLDGPAAAFTPPLPLAVNTYYWRVRATDAAGNTLGYEPVRTFNVSSTAGSAPVRTAFSTATPTLTWNRVTWAAAYEIQVARDSAFVQLAFSGEVNSLALNVTLSTLSEGLYYWRVRARNNSGVTGAWSAVDTFLIDLP